jgi:hypothetical protein
MGTLVRNPRAQRPEEATVGHAECKAEIVAVGTGEVLGTIKRSPDFGEVLDGERVAVREFRHGPSIMTSRRCAPFAS